VVLILTLWSLSPINRMPRPLKTTYGYTVTSYTSGTLPGTEHGQSLTCCNSLLAVVAVFLVRLSRD